MPVNTLSNSVAYIPRAPRVNTAEQERESGVVINGEIVDNAGSATDSPIAAQAFDSPSESGPGLVPPPSTVVNPVSSAGEALDNTGRRFATLFASQLTGSAAESISLPEGAFVSRIEESSSTLREGIQSYINTQSILSSNSVSGLSAAVQNIVGIDVFV